MRALEHDVRGVLAAVVAVGCVKVHALIEAHFHTALDNGLVGFVVFRVGQAHILDVAAFAQVEALEFVILLFKGRNVFGHIQVERIREVFRAVVFSRGKFVDQAHFLAVFVILTSKPISLQYSSY